MKTVNLISKVSVLCLKNKEVYPPKKVYPVPMCDVFPSSLPPIKMILGHKEWPITSKLG